MFRESFNMINLQTNSWIISIQTKTFTLSALVIATVFDAPSVIAISLILGVYLSYKNYRRYSALLFLVMGGEALLVLIVKTFVSSSRPLNGLVYETGFSFPSGHTTGSVVFCGLLTFLVWQYWKSPKAKTVSIILFVAIVSIVAFDRIYLNVHWFSDVLGGLLLGLSWLTFSLWTFSYVEQTKKERALLKIGMTK